MELFEMTVEDVQSYLRDRATVVIPAGSTEQHGAMAPMGCDTLVAEEICRRACRVSGTLMTPALPYGMSESHMGFSGTVSLAPMTLAAVVRDIVSSLAGAGFARVIILNAHGGNRGPALTGMYEAVREHGMLEARFLCYWELPGAMEMEEELFPGGSGYHATAAEVSMLMHLRPDFQPVAPKSPVMDMPGRGEVVGAAGWKSRFPEGPCGVDPTQVSADKGRRLLEHLSGALAELLGEGS